MVISMCDVTKSSAMKDRGIQMWLKAQVILKKLLTSGILRTKVQKLPMMMETSAKIIARRVYMCICFWRKSHSSSSLSSYSEKPLSDIFLFSISSSSATVWRDLGVASSYVRIEFCFSSKSLSPY